jgi:hypothetical protein
MSMTPQQFWAGPWATAPRMPMAADLDGDRRADLLSLWPDGEGVIDYVPTSGMGKPSDGVAIRDFGRNGIACASGEFDEFVGSDVLGVFENGEVVMASGFQAGNTHCLRKTQVAIIPTADLPERPLKTITADFNGDDAPDVLLIGSDRRAVLLLNMRRDTTAGFRPVRLSLPFPEHQQIVAGSVGGDKRARLFWLTTGGMLYRSVLNFSKSETESPTLNSPVEVLSNVNPLSKLAIGIFTGNKSAMDLLVGQWLLPGGLPTQQRQLPSLPTVEAALDDRAWIVADFDGNGKDDLLRTRRSGAQDFNEDAFVHFSYNPQTEPAKGFFSTTNDGLLDAWKLGLIRPGGLDLKAMGCRVGQRDLIVEIQPLADVPQDKLKAQVERWIRYFASIPVKNPDGSRGIVLHPIYRDPIPTTLRDSRTWADSSDMWRILWPQQILSEHRGITHYMGVQNGPAGYTEGSDRSWGMNDWRVFVHEIGHQLWLDHTGHWPQEYSAVYSSIMNYDYSDRREDSGEKVEYSAGAFASLGALKEEHLNESVPVPYEQARFLAGNPFHFPIKPGPGGESTLVDWNWNGVFGEKEVRADLNYSRGIFIDPRSGIGFCSSAPILVTQKNESGRERLLLLANEYSQSNDYLMPTRRIRGSVIAATAPVRSRNTDKEVSNGQLLSGQPFIDGKSLAVRVWQGQDRQRDGAAWSEAVAVTSKITGEFSAASLPKGATWIVYPAGGGISLKCITMDGEGKLRVSAEEVTIPVKGDCTPTLAAQGNRLVLFLWQGPSSPIRYQYLTPTRNASLAIGARQTLSLTSDVPIAVTTGGSPAGEDPCLWLSRREPNRGPNYHHTEIVQLVSASANKGTLAAGDRLWVDGVYAPYRPTLIWEPVAGIKGKGRLTLLTGGQKHPENPWAEQYMTFQTGYAAQGGWQRRRYYTDDFASLAAPGACWFQGNLAYALRQYSPDSGKDNQITFSFYGNGATPIPIGDFDDVSHLTNFGMSRSLRSVSQ